MLCSSGNEWLCWWVRMQEIWLRACLLFGWCHCLHLAVWQAKYAKQNRHKKTVPFKSKDYNCLCIIDIHMFCLFDCFWLTYKKHARWCSDKWSEAIFSPNLNIGFFSETVKLCMMATSTEVLNWLSCVCVCVCVWVCVVFLLDIYEGKDH